ncbi:MAG: type II secretion system F family protein [Candidatus Aenigmarchaeota archaeon]|nr:type II secretion system F family protein [Candidatus Aenigmarchaeota archaeon]
MKLESISYGIFGTYVKGFSVYFLDVKENLQKANLKYTLEEWLSIAAFVTLTTFVMETVIFAFIFGLMGMAPLIAILLSITLSFSIAGALLFLFYSYPGAIAKNREVKINKALPFAVSYMSSVSSADVPLIFFFKTLSQFKEYGEISTDSQSIVRDVEILGMPIHSAIKKRAKTTPSKEFKELLWGINNIYSSGGNVNVYLKGKGNELMADYRRKIKKYSQDLSLFVEIYLTLIIVGAIFFIVLSSIIASISGGAETALIQTFIVFVLLPLLSAGFMILIKSISPLS